MSLCSAAAIAAHRSMAIDRESRPERQSQLTALQVCCHLW